MEVWALIVWLTMPAEAVRGATTRPWPCHLAVPSQGPEMVDTLWRGSTHFRRQCRRIAEAGVVVVVQWDGGSLPSDHVAETRMLRDRGRLFRAVVRLSPTGESVVQLAHELEHIVEAIEGVDTRRAGWRTRSGGLETPRAKRAEAVVRQELQTGTLRPMLASR